MTLVAVISILYGVTALAALRPVAGHFAWSFRRAHNEEWKGHQLSSPNGEQWFGAFCLAALIASFWPVAVVWRITGVRLPSIGAEREAQLVARERRVRELERELEIR